MKFLSLSFSRIYSDWINHRLTFVLFFLGAMASSLVFIYFYGNAMKQDIAITEDSLEYRAFEIWFDENIPITEDQLHVLDDYGIAEVQVTSEVTLPPELIAKVPDEARIEISAARENGENIGFSLFSKEQLTQGEILIDKIYGENLTKITVNGIPFSVAGTVDHGAGVLFLPIGAYMKDIGEANYLLFLTSEILSRWEISSALQDLNTAFPQASSCQGPDVAMDFDQKSQNRELLDATFLYIASLLSFLFLFKYLQDQNQEENVIYRLTGARRTKLFAVILSEVGLLSLAACLLTSFFHKLLYFPLFSKLNTTETWISYTIADYGIITGAIVLLSLLTALPFLLVFLRETPIKLKGRFSS